MEKYSSAYWNNHYLNDQTGWDIGHIAPPLKEYFDQLTDKNIKILIPGAGNAYEVEYLHLQGFSKVYLLDFSEKSIQNFLSRCPDFPESRTICEDFFHHEGQYDLVIEQTFLSALPPSRRHEYASQMAKLIKPGGKLTGLLWNHEFPFEGPPFGGNKEEYISLFQKVFKIGKIENAHNSIKPRLGREFFFTLTKN